MKKIIVIVLFGVLLASCGKTQETPLEELTATGEVSVETSTGELGVEENTPTETEVTVEETETPSTNNTPVTATETTTVSSTATGGKTEEQIVDDFEAELDDLFDLLNDDK